MSKENKLAVQAEKPADLVLHMAENYMMTRDYFWQVVRSTVCVSKDFTDEETMVFLSVANQMGLSPVNGEIYAFKGKSGKIMPLVGIDGWLRRMNENKQFDGVVVSFNEQEQSCTCTIHRKDRSHPIIVTEYLVECRKNTGPWSDSPRRMLRHRAIIQCIRIAFGSGGAQDEDDQHYHKIAHEDLTDSTQATVDDMTARLAEVKPEAITEIPPEADEAALVDSGESDSVPDGPWGGRDELFPVNDGSADEPPVDMVPCSVKACPNEAQGACAECHVPLCGNHVNGGLCVVCYTNSL